MAHTFSLLGPLSIHHDDRVVTVAAAKPRALLAFLLLEANRQVPTERLITELWGEEPPRSATANLRTYIAGLRSRVESPSAEIETVRDGYVLRCAADACDAEVFRRTVSDGRHARAADDLPEALAKLDQAIGLWRGRALEDVPLGPRLVWHAERLEAERVEVFEDSMQLRLDLGHHAEVLTAMRRHVQTHPLRERAHSLLMLAAYRSGDVAGALKSFMAARSVLRNQLGIEPGPELSALHRAILRRDRDLAAPPVAAVRREAPLREVTPPRQLPAAPGTFVGRREEIATALRLARSAPAVGRPRLVAISGRAGVGKSALARHIAHELADEFPDGQLYLNLQGANPDLPPIPGTVAVHRLLQGLGVPAGDIPAAPAEAEALLRSTVADRSLMIVLDDAAYAHQVMPLLPAAPGCLVLITSRAMPIELDGAAHIRLAPLDPDCSAQLLSEITGAERVAADLASARAVAELCEHLPLALRVTGARLAAQPHRTLADLSVRLADEHHRLDLLELGEAGVRSSLRVTLDQLRTSGDPVDVAAATAFTRLSAAHLATFSDVLVARELGLDAVAAEGVVDRLVTLHLLEPAGPGRFRILDLLRLVGAEACEDGAAVMGRIYSYYAATAWHAVYLLRPGIPPPRTDLDSGVRPPDSDAAAAWLHAEMFTILGVARRCADRPDLAHITMDLLHCLTNYLPSRGHWAVLADLSDAGLTAAEAVGDARARGLALSALASVDRSRGDFELALNRLAQAYGIYVEAGYRPGTAAVLDWLALVLTNLEQPQAAIGCLQRSLGIHLDLGRTAQAATTLHNMAEAYAQLGRYPAAERLLRRCLPMRRNASDVLGEACTTVVTGLVRALRGDLRDAAAWLDAGLEQATSSGYSEMEWEAAITRAWVRLAAGDPSGVDDCKRAADVARRLGDRYRVALVDAVHRRTVPDLVRAYRGPRSFLVERLILGADPSAAGRGRIATPSTWPTGMKPTDRES
ncbi:MAG: tetratricopeptide repeat protein [Hamadaea sp.]|nr:tetratricopeptide repeat protein [Hamadaea sp.]NUR52508.1 tetratricopeptide repeat protein [Hamadaea sp.]NUT02484.1 tetratricopeptide repeat protein [Hamadaea sp.]